MKQSTKRLIILLAVGQIMLALFIISLPRLVEALPGRIRASGRFPSALSELALTPVPTALPAPQQTPDLDAIVIPTRIPPTNTPTPIPTATPLPSPTIDQTTATPLPTATPPPTATPLPSPTPILSQNIITGLENRPQSFNNCGPANMSMVLNFFDNETSQTDAAAYLKPNPEDRNVSPWQISDYVNEQTNLKALTRSGGTIELIEQLVAANIPVVIEKGYDPPTDEGWYGHYLTVFGYDRHAREIYSMDTYLGPWNNEGRIDSYDEISYYWQQFNYTFYIVYPTHREAEVYAILGDEQVDDFTMWQNAALRAEAEKDVDPENAYAWFNLGTSLTRMGELTGEQQYYQSGAAAFDQALTLGLPGRMMWYQFRPYLAYMKTQRYTDMQALADATLTTAGGRNVEETYLYRGHANAFLGDLAAARSDYQRALQLNKNFYVAEIALNSLP